MKKKVFLALVIFILTFATFRFSSYGQSSSLEKTSSPSSISSNFVLVEIPEDISKEEALNPNDNLQKRLRSLVEVEVKKKALPKKTEILPAEEPERPLDLIIIHTKDGKPLFPDLEKARGQPQAKLFYQKTAADNEISFTFNSPDIPFSQEELTNLQTWINRGYPLIKQVFGPPAFNITVNVKKDELGSAVAGTYSSWSNEITLDDNWVDERVFYHELAHGFHDDAIIYLNNYEEGMARMVENEVYWQVHPDAQSVFNINSWYEARNQPAIASYGGGFWRLSSLVNLRYDFGSIVWYKLYLENNLFLQQFNQQYYQEVLIDNQRRSDEAGLKKIAGSLTETSEGTEFNHWYQQQMIMNLKPAAGVYLYASVSYGYLNILTMFKDAIGSENILIGEVGADFFDYHNQLLASRNIALDENGYFSWTRLDFLPNDYQGRLKIELNYHYQNQIYQQTIFTYRDLEINDPEALSLYYLDRGVFGLIQDNLTGNVTITFGDQRVTVPVINGIFTTNGFRDYRGPVRLVYQNGNLRIERTINKPPANYFVWLDDDIDRQGPFLSLSDLPRIVSGGTIDFTVTAEDQSGVNLVEFYSYQPFAYDQTPKFENAKTSPPYFFSWDTATAPERERDYWLVAVAYDSLGNPSSEIARVYLGDNAFLQDFLPGWNRIVWTEYLTSNYILDYLFQDQCGLRPEIISGFHNYYRSSGQFAPAGGGTFAPDYFVNRATNYNYLDFNILPAVPYFIKLNQPCQILFYR